MCKTSGDVGWGECISHVGFCIVNLWRPEGRVWPTDSGPYKKAPKDVHISIPQTVTMLLCLSKGTLQMGLK